MKRLSKDGRAYLLALVTGTLCRKCGVLPAVHADTSECAGCKWRRVIRGWRTMEATP